MKNLNRGMKARKSVYFTMTVIAVVFGLSAMLVISAVAANGIDNEKVNNVKTVVMSSGNGQEETSKASLETETEAKDVTVEEQSITFARINTDDVNFRDAASTDSTVICILPYGSEHVIVAGDNNGWTCLNVEGVGIGYVSSDFVETVTGTMKEKTEEDRQAIAIGVMYAEAYERELAAWEESSSYEEDTEEIVYDDAEEEYIEDSGDEEEYYSEESYYEEEYYQADEWYEEDSWEEDEEDSWEAPEYVEADSPWSGSSEDDYDNEDYYEEDYEQVSYADQLRQEVVDYACSFAGWLPYVWGGHSLTTGADCSGFVAAVYAEFGYNLSYSSDTMSYQGRSVPLSEAKPGDIIVYSGHVTMYVGNGQKVHSPYPGTTVTIDSIYYETILDVRRIIED